MNAHIRLAAPQDARGIAQVHVQSWRETYAGLMSAAFLERMTDEAAQQRREQSWRQTIESRRETVYVAEQGGEVVAFASGGDPRDHPGYDSELMALYSLKRVHGQGIGKALLQTLAQQLRASGAKNMALRKPHASLVRGAGRTRSWRKNRRRTARNPHGLG